MGWVSMPRVSRWGAGRACGEIGHPPSPFGLLIGREFPLTRRARGAAAAARRAALSREGRGLVGVRAGTASAFALRATADRGERADGRSGGVLWRWWRW